MRLGTHPGMRDVFDRTALPPLRKIDNFPQGGDTSVLWTCMNKQLISILATAAAAATSLFISAGTSHADFNPAAPSFVPTVKTMAEPERPASDASDSFTVQTKGPSRCGCARRTSTAKRIASGWRTLGDGFQTTLVGLCEQMALAWCTSLDLECLRGWEFLRTDGQDVSQFSDEIEHRRALVAQGSDFAADD